MTRIVFFVDRGPESGYKYLLSFYCRPNSPCLSTPTFTPVLQTPRARRSLLFGSASLCSAHSPHFTAPRPSFPLRQRQFSCENFFFIQTRKFRNGPIHFLPFRCCLVVRLRPGRASQQYRRLRCPSPERPGCPKFKFPVPVSEHH
jgi:hypothetical protein